MLELFQFQREAASNIADRFVDYVADPITTGRASNRRTVPFYQALSSITGSGKTAILAQAVSDIGVLSELAPVVLWLSKGKVVVSQSFSNLTDGGKYSHLLGDATVRLLSEYDPQDVAQAEEELIYFATVGTFNQREKESGNLKIFQSEIDTTETSTWEAIKSRQTTGGVRRPLVVVYDEAQNLSDQQTDLLLELQPTAVLLTSATPSFPERFLTEVIDPLRNEGFTDDDLTTVVASAVVVESGLVKSTILAEGLNLPMEETVNAMLDAFREAEQDAVSEGVSFKPKAIYVCNTNVVDGDDQITDDPHQAFEQRQAPPILIWRHLTERCGIPANEVAVYADLKTHKDYPLPAEFDLFPHGESDYETFTAGDYRHIIFNLTLQEGWDDPATYFAYIDKSMESRVQITQIVGRVLRQPGAVHYSAGRLNTAHFYVRVDRNNAFADVVEDIRRGLGGHAPEVRIVVSPPGTERPIRLLPRTAASLSRTAIVNDEAKPAVAKVIEKLSDYSTDKTNTVASGRRRTFTQTVGSDDASGSEWSDFQHSSQVSARWVFRREVSRRYRPALTVTNTDGPKFDAKVGVGSNAFAHVGDIAEQAVYAYLDHAVIKQVRPNPYEVGSILVRMSDIERFENSLHQGYDRLTSLESKFARALDTLGLPWCRNPAQTGYKIPLISTGSTVWFFPDFLLWSGNSVFCLETKGEHLVQSDAGRKLLTIIPHESAKSSLNVRLISGGSWASDGTQDSKDGYTLWGLRQDQKLKTDVFEDLEELVRTFA